MESLENVLASIVDTIRQDRKFYKNYLSENAIDAGTQLARIMKGADDNTADAILELFKKEIPYEHPYMAVWWYSVLLDIKKDAGIFYELVRYIRENREAFSNNTQDYLYYQLIYMYDANPSLYSDKTKMELWRFFLEIVEAFAQETEVSLDEIPESKRDKDLVLVIIIQYLSHGNAPTVTALDRCRILQEKMGKKVLLINTAEAVNTLGFIHFMKAVGGNHTELNERETVEWKGTSIPCFQCPPKMPDMEVINLLLENVRDMAPGRVILISGGSILGNLINRIVPALTISTGFSDLSITGARYQAVGRKLTEEDLIGLTSIGLDKNHVIESTFTFDIKPQKEKISRRELGIAEDAFVLAMVGIRLDYEVTNELLQMLDKTLREKMMIVFIGYFSGYQEKIKRFPGLEEKSMSLGFCDDILSRLEACDVYVNPRRKGGGSSVVEAMYLGKPVVSIAYGDVALNAGEEFCVSTYEEMSEKLLQYYEDKDYYAAMSQKAKDRADVLLDTETAFREIMAEYDRRERAAQKES